jgi:hypothetical protein
MQYGNMKVKYFMLSLYPCKNEIKWKQSNWDEEEMEQGHGSVRGGAENWKQIAEVRRRWLEWRKISNK